jgi:hypothetical protein
MQTYIPQPTLYRQSALRGNDRTEPNKYILDDMGLGDRN